MFIREFSKWFTQYEVVILASPHFSGLCGGHKWRLRVGISTAPSLSIQ